MTNVASGVPAVSIPAHTPPTGGGGREGREGRCSTEGEGVKVEAWRRVEH